MLKIIPAQAEVVKHIYYLSLNKEYGSAKIAKLLNEEEPYKALAPNDTWKSGTITSILTNPIYAGYVAYKRRERINGKYHRQDDKDWIKAASPNKEIQIIDEDTWDRTQDKRKLRSDKYLKTLEHKNVNVIRRNDGVLALIDVIHCGYCGRKLTNGTKYSYWTIKATGEKRVGKTPLYRCQSAQAGIPHNKVNQFRADKIEDIVFGHLGEYINKLLESEDIMTEIKANQAKERKNMEAEIKKLKTELKKTTRGIEVMQERIPEAMTGDYPLTVEELADAIHKQQEKEHLQKQLIKEKEEILKRASTGNSSANNGTINNGATDSGSANNGAADNGSANNRHWQGPEAVFPTWKEIFKEADSHTKRVLVNKLIERINVTEEQIVIYFK